MACLNCNTQFYEAQRYLISDLGPEIITIIERQIDCEIGNEAEICQDCFDTVLQELHDVDEQIMPQITTVRSDEHAISQSHDTNVCVWCRSSLFRRRTHSLLEGLERNEISLRINPRVIPDNGLVCYACWIRVHRIVQDSGEPSQLASPSHGSDTNVCVWCRVALNQRRIHELPEGPERNEIAERIFPREIPNGGRVCYACWVCAQRNVRRMNSEPSQHIPERNFCVSCRVSLLQRRKHLLRDGPGRDEITARIHPREIPDGALVCHECFTRAQEVIHFDENIPGPEPRTSNETMTLDNFRVTPNSSSRCFVPGCTNAERLIVPNYLRKRILKSKKVYATENSRVCEEHKTLYNWDILDDHNLSPVFSKNIVELALMLSIEDEDENMLDFENIDSIRDTNFKYWTGISKEIFLNILNAIPMLSELSKHPKTALRLYLLKSRTGDSHDRIASLFHMSKASVSRLLSKARAALKTQFVPLHLGFTHITREEHTNRNLLIPEGLFGDRNNRKPIVICGGTYVYLQKSSNYLFQKKTYSLHKYRNLVKPFLFVATNGHILDVCGPYPATTSDAIIIRDLFQNENGDCRRYFRQNDIFILDRGFRDAIPFLESLNYVILKPESLEEGETQLSTERANKSRCVTLCRWVVEVVNGRFKRDFKIFRSEFFNLAATHLMDDFKISAAIINAFHPEIVNRLDALSILNRALQRINLHNYLAEYVIENNINRRRAHFTRINGEHTELDIFPRMTMSDLILFGLGIYQIKQACSYYGEHIRQHGSFEVEISNQLEVTTVPEIPSSSSHETVLIRGRIRSRHYSNKIYNTYILLKNVESWEDAIVVYYCSCICGKRTVGCCAHVMTMVWYLGWARHEDNIEALALFLDGILVRDDIENEEEL